MEGIYGMSEWYVRCLDGSEGKVRTSQVRIGKVRTDQDRCLEDVSGRCLKGFWRVSQRCVEGIYGISEWYVRCLDVSEGKSGLVKLG